MHQPIDSLPLLGNGDANVRFAANTSERHNCGSAQAQRLVELVLRHPAERTDVVAALLKRGRIRYAQLAVLAGFILAAAFFERCTLNGAAGT